MEKSLSIPQARELPREIIRSVKLTTKNFVNDILPFRIFIKRKYGKRWDGAKIDPFFN